LPGTKTEARTFNEVKALHLRRKLQGAPPPDVEAVRRHLKDFTPPQEGLMMRVRLSRQKADVFKPRPGSRETYKQRVKTHREALQQKNETVRRAFLEMAEGAVRSLCFVALELPLPSGLTWDEAITHRSLYRRRVRQRKDIPKATNMYVAIREREGQPASLAVLCDRQFDELGELLDCGPMKEGRVYSASRRQRCVGFLREFGGIDAIHSSQEDALSALS